ncbi:hypothetical protein AGABI2DRAFT_122188 [Agaricus bisporus var. bisporus H97]|uniref:hypothetical protein n=1 Tax=Agaricus bisporus var. bisporus (strain H97 / ATCC MYA-4626 / FGSC 10389) TaxID=936046 RepID=UPI00029F6A9C|nr:hypothetical protein AGABI2DRAFT_122188 [Agaricus bisporus var. bisporus H97]EKV43285.1 hypothetical protein AGABI2DRAFT_122188 [Agaricus bisporus var. bisporus H97]
MVKIPPEELSWESMAFHHPSFCEYLIDYTRSQIFYISMENAETYIWRLLIKIWQDFRKFSSGLSDWDYVQKWTSYCLQYHSATNSSDNPLILDFDADLFHDIHDAPFSSIQQYGTARLVLEQSRDEVFHMLGQLDLTTICIGFRWWKRKEFVIWLFDIWNTYQVELTSQGLIHEADFQELRFDYSYGCLSPHTLHCKEGSTWQILAGIQEEHEKYILGLQLFQQRQPQLQVLIGGSPGEKFAVFVYEYTEDDLKEQMHRPRHGSWSAEDLGYYILPYHEKV